MAYVRLQLNLHPPPIKASTILAGPPIPCPTIGTLWMTPKSADK